MIRRIIQIDEEKCNGCGACAAACHEGAIAIVNGKAKLLRDDYCDGLGDCLPACPMDAIHFVEREAQAYDEAAVQRAKRQSEEKSDDERHVEGRLGNWPVQIKLAPVNAPCFQDARLLIAADCTAFAYGSFHKDFLTDRVALIGCPKLDGVDYSQKLRSILENNNIREILLVRMEVPCCGGLEYAVKKAMLESGRIVPFRVVIIGTDGRILEN